MPDVSLGDLAQRFHLHLDGDPNYVVNAIAPLGRARPGELSFISDKRRRRELATTQAGAVVMSEELSSHFRGNKLISENAHAAFARIASVLYPTVAEKDQGVHPSAVIDPSAVLGSRVSVGANVSIGRGVSIGDDCVIGAGSVIEDDVRMGNNCILHSNIVLADATQLGNAVIVHAGAVIGSDGFGLAREGERWIKVPQIGRVVIGDDVEVGANTTIDRGAMDDTVIAEGVKLDNLIQVAHNVRIGAHTAIAACVGIAGSAVIGKRCTIGGAAVVLGHLEIVDDVHITAMSLVTKSIEDAGTYSSGTPLEKNASWHRNFVRIKQLDEMAKRLSALERRGNRRD